MSFKDDMKNDLSEFLNEDEFAEEVHYFLGSVSAKVVVQFFDEESNLGNSLVRKVILRVSDLPNLSNEGIFKMKDGSYKVLSFIKEESGLIFNIITQKGE